METQSVPATSPVMTAALAQGIPSRKLIDFTIPRGTAVTDSRDLETVRDSLRKRRTAQDPVDHSRTLAQCHLSFGNGTRRAAFSFMSPTGLEAPMALTHHALRAIGREVLPGRGMDFLLDEVNLGENGRKLADMNYALFGRNATEPRMLRTCNLRDPVTNMTVRAVRSVHSMDYAPYDNLEFVEDLLSGGWGKCPVIAITETDQSLRLRFIVGDDLGEGMVYGKGHTIIPGGKPIPMVEAWNSEVGSRAVTLKPGMFRLVCTNGAGTWEDQSIFRWIHRGDRNRIQIGVKDAMTELKTSAAGVVTAYESALGVAIDDAYAWFERAVKGEDIGKAEVAAVQKALHDPTTTPGGLLTSVVDAVTLAAQDAIDEFEQERMETIGVRLLRRGLVEGLKNNGRITVADA